MNNKKKYIAPEVDVEIVYSSEILAASFELTAEAWNEDPTAWIYWKKFVD